MQDEEVAIVDPLVADVEITFIYAYIHGYPDGTVQPEGRITRAEAATMIYNLTLAEDKKAGYRASCADVSPEDWYAPVIGYLDHYSVVTGYSDGTFTPDGPHHPGGAGHSCPGSGTCSRGL